MHFIMMNCKFIERRRNTQHLWANCAENRPKNTITLLLYRCYDYEFISYYIFVIVMHKNNWSWFLPFQHRYHKDGIAQLCSFLLSHTAKAPYRYKYKQKKRKLWLHMLCFIVQFFIICSIFSWIHMKFQFFTLLPAMLFNSDICASGEFNARYKTRLCLMQKWKRKMICYICTVKCVHCCRFHNKCCLLA